MILTILFGSIIVSNLPALLQDLVHTCLTALIFFRKFLLDMFLKIRLGILSEIMNISTYGGLVYLLFFSNFPLTNYTICELKLLLWAIMGSCTTYTHYFHSKWKDYTNTFNVERLDMNRIGFVMHGTMILAASLALGACTLGTVNAQNEAII